MRGDKVKIPKKETVIGANIHNRFDIEVIDSRTGKVRQRAQAENVILNQMWGVLCSSSQYYWNGQIQYGTGAGTPSATDTALFNYLGLLSTRENTFDSDRKNQIYSVTSKYVMDETTAAGQTLTEIGIGQRTNNSTIKGTLMTHAMFRDMNGNPISIEKTDTDILNIYATVYVHMELPSWVNCYGHIGSDGTNTPITAIRHFLGLVYWQQGREPMAAYSSGYRIATFGNSPDEKYSYSKGDPTLSYNASQKTVSLTYPRVKAEELNPLTAIREVFICGRRNTSGNAYDSHDPDFGFIVSDDWCTKGRIMNETVGTGNGTTVNFKTKFKPSGNITIKVDGQQAAATVRSDYLGSNFKNYFKLISGNRSLSGSTDLSPWDYPGNKTPEDACIFENTIHESVGIASLFSSSYASVSWALCSSDLDEWVRIDGSNVPEQYQNYPYWQLFTTASTHAIFSPTPNASLPPVNNIHFNTAPAAGAIITADYDTDTIAKDENHVFDFSVTFQFGEYTEAE